MTDLFMGKKDQLKHWLKNKYLVRTSSIMRWGVDNQTTGAGRYARQLREEGFLRRLTKKEVLARNIKTVEGIYEVIGT